LGTKNQQKRPRNESRFSGSNSDIIFLSGPWGPNKVTPITLHPSGDSEIVIGAETADDLKPEPRNVHRLGAAD
jgi:hypothetical protein